MISSDTLFACTQCGQCCRGFGGTYVSSRDQQAIADFLGMPLARFLENHCVPSGNRMLLAQDTSGYCVFYKQNCSIHPVKPRMCRRWPFIDALLVDVANWHAMAGSCPGMRTGVDDATLCRALRLIIAAKPS